MKHIESIQPEYAADDMTALLLSDATASAALTALLQQWTGCAIPPLATTPESEVEELVPLCLSILRRHWTTPLTALGDGTTPMSLADLMRRLIGDRVQGNESLGIPPFNDNIATAVAALCDRHIADGLTLTLTDGGADGSTPTTTSLPDGLSLAQLFCSGLADNITELQDSNKGWGALAKFNLLTLFPNLTSLSLSCTSTNFRMLSKATMLENLSMPYWEGSSNYDGVFYDSFTENTELDFPSLLELRFGSNFTPCFSGNKFKRFTATNIKYIRSNGTNSPCFYNSPNLEEIYMPSLEYCNHYGITTQGGGLANNCPKLTKVVVGSLSSTKDYGYGGTSANGMGFPDCPNLVHLEFGGDGSLVSVSVDARWWNPTTALAERLPEFLSNFKTYIAQRLTDKGSGLTLTLSQAVRDAIQTDPEIVSIITSKGWTISPAPSV